MTRTGGCLCGAVRFSAEIGKPHFSACHCGMCRRWTGGPGLGVETREVKFEGEENIAIYRSSDWAERAFCRICGSSLYYRFTGEGPLAGSLHMQLGLLDDDSGLEFGEEIFIDRKSAGYAFAGDHKRMTEAEVMALFTAATKDGAPEMGDAPETAEGPAVEMVHDEDDIVILGAFRPDADRLVVVFNDVDYGKNMTPFRRTLNQIGRPAALFVSDRHKRFYALPGQMERVAAVVRKHITRFGVSEIHTLGYSMGAYGAVGAAQFLPVRVAVSVTPHWTIDAAIVRDARPNTKVVATMAPWAIPTLAEGLRAAKSVYLIHGTRGSDNPHLRKFPRLPNLDHWIMPGVKHDVPGELTQKRMVEYIAAALDDDRERVAAVMLDYGAIRPDTLAAKAHVAFGAYRHWFKYAPRRLRAWARPATGARRAVGRA